MGWGQVVNMRGDPWHGRPARCVTSVLFTMRPNVHTPPPSLAFYRLFQPFSCRHLPRWQERAGGRFLLGVSTPLAHMNSLTSVAMIITRRCTIHPPSAAADNGGLPVPSVIGSVGF